MSASSSCRVFLLLGHSLSISWDCDKSYTTISHFQLKRIYPQGKIITPNPVSKTTFPKLVTNTVDYYWSLFVINAEYHTHVGCWIWATPETAMLNMYQSVKIWLTLTACCLQASHNISFRITRVCQSDYHVYLLLNKFASKYMCTKIYSDETIPHNEQ